MSIIERSLSRGRNPDFVSAPFLHESHLRSCSYHRIFSALRYSISQAVAAPETIVLRPGSRPVDLDLKITQTLAGETPSLRATPMWYVIYC
jgi:hypothetical protein